MIRRSADGRRDRSDHASPTLALLALAMGGFTIGTTEFTSMSLLPQMAAGLRIDAPTASHAISAYALGVVVGAPVLAVLGARVARHRLLIAFMAMIALFNGLSALAPTYHLMLVARFLSGLPHGAYFGVGSLVAASLVPDEQRARAIGRMFLGLSAAMQLARARQDVLVVDAGQPRNRFADEAHGFLGQDGRAPAAIMREARCQVLRYPTVEIVAGEAQEARAVSDGFAVGLSSGGEYRARRLILATGVSDKLPSIPGLRERWGETVLHCPYCHGYEVRDLPLGVIAAQPLSAHQALLIPDWGPTTYFTQGAFEPDAAERAAFAARGIAIERTPVVELVGDAPALDGVRLADGRFVEVTAVFTAPRTEPATPLAAMLGCLHEDGPTGPYVKVDPWGATSVDGVWAAGDAATPMHNATLASAAGVLAGIGVHQASVRAKAA